MKRRDFLATGSALSFSGILGGLSSFTHLDILLAQSPPGLPDRDDTPAVNSDPAEYIAGTPWVNTPSLNSISRQKAKKSACNSASNWSAVTNGTGIIAGLGCLGFETGIGAIICVGGSIFAFAANGIAWSEGRFCNDPPRPDYHVVPRITGLYRLPASLPQPWRSYAEITLLASEALDSMVISYERALGALAEGKKESVKTQSLNAQKYWEIYKSRIPHAHEGFKKFGDFLNSALPSGYTLKASDWPSFRQAALDKIKELQNFGITSEQDQLKFIFSRIPEKLPRSWSSRPLADLYAASINRGIASSRQMIAHIQAIS